MSEGQMSMLIPILAITLSLGAGIILIIAWHRRNALELEQRHKERMAAIDRGLDLPVEPVKLAAPARPHYLLRGLIWLGVGLALVVGMRPMLEAETASIGWIPVAVGAAYLLFYFIEGRKAPRTGEKPPQDNSNPGSQP